MADNTALFACFMQELLAGIPAETLEEAIREAARLTRIAARTLEEIGTQHIDNGAGSTVPMDQRWIPRTELLNQQWVPRTELLNRPFSWGDSPFPSGEALQTTRVPGLVIVPIPTVRWTEPAAPPDCVDACLLYAARVNGAPMWVLSRTWKRDASEEPLDNGTQETLLDYDVGNNLIDQLLHNCTHEDVLFTGAVNLSGVKKIETLSGNKGDEK